MCIFIFILQKQTFILSYIGEGPLKALVSPVIILAHFLSTYFINNEESSSKPQMPCHSSPKSLFASLKNTNISPLNKYHHHHHKIRTKFFVMSNPRFMLWFLRLPPNLLHSWPLSKRTESRLHMVCSGPGCGVPRPHAVSTTRTCRPGLASCRASTPGLVWWLLVLSFLQLEVRSEGPLDLS